jgi:hypothetical protein
MKSRFATNLAGGLIAYLAARRGDRAILRQQQGRTELEFQTALRVLLIEILRGAELALSGSGTIMTSGNASCKALDELEAGAEAYEGKIPFPCANYFRDWVWSKYDDVLIEHLDTATIYIVDTAYSSARRVF